MGGWVGGGWERDRGGPRNNPATRPPPPLKLGLGVVILFSHFLLIVPRISSVASFVMDVSISVVLPITVYFFHYLFFLYNILAFPGVY